MAYANAGCSNEIHPSTSYLFDGSEVSIRNFVTPALLSTMTRLGLQVNPGSLPPQVNGQYLASKLKLLSSNIDTDVVNSIFADTYFVFQRQQALTIDLSYATANGSEFSRNNACFIAGKGNRFTVLGKQQITEDEGTADSIIIISGRILPTGIADFQFAAFITDNHGVSGFIENGHGRIFYDSDNVAVKQ